jgi:hypothetical protein
MILTFNCSNLSLVVHNDEGDLIYGHTASNVETKLDIHGAIQTLTSLTKEIFASIETEESEQV